jgi:type VI secretion system secreted protein VgrG
MSTSDLASADALRSAVHGLSQPGAFADLLAWFGTIGLTDAERAIRLRMSTEHGTLANVLMAQRIELREGLCEGFEGHVTCLSARAGLPLEAFLGVPLEVQLVTDRGALRPLCGIVTHARAGQSDGGLALYQLTLRDALAIMERRTNTRVFRKLSVPDITRVLFDEWRQANAVLARAFDFEFVDVDAARHPAREFTLQYNESDAAFLRRLWKREGIGWFVRAGRVRRSENTPPDDTPAHTLVLFDDAMQLAANRAGAIRYHRDGATEARDGITLWAPERQLVPGRVERRSWDYKGPAAAGAMVFAADDAVLDQGVSGNALAASLEDAQIDVPHAGDDGEHHARLTRRRIQHHEREGARVHGESGVRDLAVGEWNPVSGHPDLDGRPEAEREFLVTQVHHRGENNLPKTLGDRVQALLAASAWTPPAEHTPDRRYRNRFTAVRRDVPLVPAWNPRQDLPLMHPMTAIVVGPPGEEVHCDELGRIKIQFLGLDPEDHVHAHGAGTSGTGADSAWVRVASYWAAEGWGAIHLPRVGDEVVIEFLAGDPDRPLVTGLVYNSRSRPPRFSGAGSLPANRHLAGVRSREIRGAGYGELLFDDTTGEIKTKLSSEHGKTQLNQGWIGHPRSEGASSRRGEGFELRTDLAGALRAAQLLISTDLRPGAGGETLDRQELLGNLQTALAIATQLSDLATAHAAEPTDTATQARLLHGIEQWDGGKPAAAAIALSAPAGIAMASPMAVGASAGTNLDLVAAQDANLSAGRKLLLRAAEGFSAFAKKLGIELIAGSGDVRVQAHAGKIELGAAERLHAYSLKEALFEAERIVLRGGGAEIVLADGRVTIGAAAGVECKAPDFRFGGGYDGGLELPGMPASSMKTDERIALAGRAGQAREHLPYEVRDAAGAVAEAGESNADGATRERVTDTRIKPLFMRLKP